jgi:predicted GNAT family acetyltransferase
MHVIHNNFGASRFDAYIDGAVAGSLHYQMQGEQLWLLHTAVDETQRGQGLGTGLIRNALADAHRRRLEVLPFCHEVRKQIFAHPVYYNLVPEADRESFRKPVEGQLPVWPSDRRELAEAGAR